ncbi:MAG: hypothetical protein FJ137_18685 [Deltaproteobacteria bacterium]|nr:hypothetical protein [Deltaproteobacteria bacterium]
MASHDDDVFPAALVLGMLAAVGPVAVEPIALAGARALVLPDPRPEHSGDDERVAAALQARGLVSVASAERAGVDGVVAEPGRGDRERVRALLTEARAHTRTLDLDAATVVTAAALDEGLRLERPEDHRELLVDVLLHDATLRLSVDKQDPQALASLRVAARLEPARDALDPALHAPSVVAAWSQARAENAAAPTVLVAAAPRVIGLPAPGPVELIVDGFGRVVDEGLVSLPAGPHLLTWRATGCRPQTRLVNVAREAASLAATLQPPGAAAARAAAVAASRAPGSEPVGALARLGALSGADVVVALGETPRVWRATAGVRDIPAAVDDVGDFADAVVVALRGAPAAAATPASASASTARPGAPGGDGAVDVATTGPTPGPTTDTISSGVVAAAAAGVVIVLAGGLVAAVALWPGTPPSPPPRPVVVTAVVP